MCSPCQCTLWTLSRGIVVIWGKKHVLSLVGMTSFYSELNKGLGASTKIWELTDRVPVIPLTGKSSTTVTNPSTTKLYFNKFNLYYINMLINSLR